MTPRVKKDIEDRINKIQRGKFNSDDIKLLFIDLRDSLDRGKGSGKETEMLYDIFHFCAHPNARDRGKVFMEVRKKASETVKALKKSFSFTLASTPTDLNILETLCSMLRELGITYDKRLLSRQMENIASYVYKILKSVPLEMEDEDIEKIETDYDQANGYPVLKFKMKPFKAINYALDSDGNKLIGEDGKPMTTTISGEPTLIFRLM